jgi:hypothetical protein
LVLVISAADRIVLRFRVVSDRDGPGADAVAEQDPNIDVLVVARVGRVEEVVGGPVPYRLVDAFGTELVAVTEFLRDLSASGCSPTTLRSYAYELLGWLRFWQAVAVPWDRATRAEARDCALWLARVRKPQRDRRRDSPAPGRSTRSRGSRESAAAVQPNGQIVVVGSSFKGTSVFGVARLDTNGSLDTAFGNSGVLTTSFAGGDLGDAVLIQPNNGDIIAVGQSQNSAGVAELALARYIG